MENMNKNNNQHPIILTGMHRSGTSLLSKIFQNEGVYLLLYYVAGTRYKFRVSAENRHGMSQESQAVTTRMMEEGRNILP